MWSRSRRLGLETVSRRTNISSRSRLGAMRLISVSSRHNTSRLGSRLGAMHLGSRLGLDTIRLGSRLRAMRLGSRLGLDTIRLVSGLVSELCVSGLVSVSTQYVSSRVSSWSYASRVSSRSRHHMSRLGSQTISSRRDILCRRVPCIAAVRPMKPVWHYSWVRIVSSLRKRSINESWAWMLQTNFISCHRSSRSFCTM